MTDLRETAAVVDRLGRLVSGIEDIGPLLSQLCSAVGAATGASVAVLRDSGGTGLEVPAACGAFASGPSGALLAAARTLASAALAAGEERAATVRPATGQQPERPEWCLLALPLLLDDRVGDHERAAVVLARGQPPWVGPEERASARLVADDLSTLVASALLAEQLRGELAAQSAKRRLLAEGATTGTTLEAAQIVAAVVRDVLTTDCSIVFTYPDGEDGRLNVAVEGLAPDQKRAVWRALRRGLAGSAGWQKAIQSDDPIFVEEVGALSRRPGGLVESSGLRSYLSVPLHSGSDRVGHIMTGDVRGPRRWTPSERLLVAQLAAEATLVLDGARLRETERAQRNLLAHQASHDALTGLANRRAFTDELAAAIATAGPDGRRLAVLMLDLDGFKEVNDSLGHHVGDALLVEVSQAILRAPCLPHRCARLGGDEFALLLDTDEPAALRVARQLSAAIARICAVDGHRLSVRASVGVALYPDQGADGAQLLRSADAAMYAAKRGGRPPLEPARPAPAANPGLLAELHEALERGDLVVHYQPQVSLADGAIVSAEALARWAHPERGPLLPGQFLPAAARGGLLPRLGRLVLDAALDQQRDWRRTGLELRVAVNIAGADLYEAGFVDHVAACLDRFDLPPSALTFELSEQALVASRHAAAGVLAALRSLGVRVSLDNFGTIGSSLGHLDSLPIDELKIDRSFLRNSVARDDGMLGAIVSLCHDLSVTVVAEGVETATAAERLAALGCDLAQGFLYGPPVPADELARAFA